MNTYHQLKDLFNRKSLHWASVYPKAWSLGWLTQLSIAVILYSITILLALLLPISNTYTPSVESWFSIAFIPTVFWWLFTIYRLIKYNSEKLYGNRSLAHNFIELPSYLGQFLLPIMIPIMLSLILTSRIGNLETEKKLNDYKASYELAEPFFTMVYGCENLNKLDIQYYSGNLKFFESKEDYYQSIVNRRNYYRSFTSEEERLKDLKTGNILNHRNGYEHQRPQLYPKSFYDFRYPYKYDEHPDNKYNLSEIRGDSLKEIYFYTHFEDSEFLNNVFNEYIKSLEEFEERKYSGVTATDLTTLFENKTYNYLYAHDLRAGITILDESTNRFRDQINYINRCQSFRFFFFDFEFLMAILLMAASAAVFLAMFKNSSIIEFIVGIIALVTIPFVSILILAFNRVDSDIVIFTFWVELILLLILGFREDKLNLRRKRGAFLRMIPHVILPFILLIILLTLDEVFRFWKWDYFDKYLYHNPTEYDPNNMSYNETYYFIKRWSWCFMTFLGFLLYYSVWYPLWIKKSWISFLAKPKKS